MKFSFRRWNLITVLFMAGLLQARAHAFLDRAEPKVGSTVTSTPTEIKLWFTQELEPAFSSIEVRDSSGNEVDKKNSHPDDKNKALLIISVPPLPAGTYTIYWRVVSVDTHKTQGHFEFTIKPDTK